MQPNEVIEGNRVIAEFLGKTYKEEDGYGEKGYLYPVNGNFGRRLMQGQMLYHSSWDWLMPVVEKISRIEVERRFDEDLDKWVIWTHHPVTFGMLDEQGRPMVRFCYNALHSGNTLIEATWLAVVDFIKTNSQLNNKG